MFEVWWKITEEMMKKLVTLFLLVFTISCSQIDQDSFTLVCDVDTNVVIVDNGVRSEYKKNEIVTLIFKNKKLDVYDCQMWTDDSISCGVHLKDDKDSHQERMILDRKSGIIKFYKIRQDPTRIEKKEYIGKCEKVKENKF
jgi:hypothetical protein